jgi:hypothetical protein
MGDKGLPVQISRNNRSLLSYNQPDAQVRLPWRLAMFKLIVVLGLAALAWCALATLDWILGIGVFAAVFGVIAAAFGIVLGVLGAVFGIVAGVLGGVFGVLVVALLPVLLLVGIVALLKAAF